MSSAREPPDPFTCGHPLGAHTAAALMARDLGETGTDADRQFEFVVSYDRNLVTAAAQSMIERLTTA
jgi:hypothetical protein